MTAAITARVGLVGVLVGVLLSFFLQRRLWQTQEAMKAYSELFATAEETLMICNGIIEYIDNDLFAEAREQNAQFRQEHDPVLHRLLRQCWMLERDAGIRERIEDVQHRYQRSKVGITLRFQKSKDKRKETFDRMIANEPRPGSVFPVFESLQREVAAKYFHGGAPGGDMGGEDQQER